jgi:single-strand DNA-binding protein
MVTLVGTLGADPEVRRTPQGKDVANFNLVVNERIRNADGTWSDGAASWFRIAAWNDLGRNAGMSLRKGQRVIVRGSLKIEQWQAKDGGTARAVVLTAVSLGHDLKWGTSSFVKQSTRPAAQQQSQHQQQGEAPDGWATTPSEPAEASDDSRVLQPAWSGPMTEVDETPF